MTEPDNATLDNAFNNATQLTIEFQTRQTTLATNRNFLSKWNYGSTGAIAIATGQHAGNEGEISVWFATASGKVAGVIETQGANLQPAHLRYRGRLQRRAGADLRQRPVATNGRRSGRRADGSGFIDWYSARTRTLERRGQLYRRCAVEPQHLDRGQDAGPDSIAQWRHALLRANEYRSAARAWQSLALTQASGPATDAVTGSQMQNPTGVVPSRLSPPGKGPGRCRPSYSQPDRPSTGPVASVPAMNSSAGHEIQRH